MNSLRYHTIYNEHSQIKVINTVIAPLGRSEIKFLDSCNTLTSEMSIKSKADE